MLVAATRLMPLHSGKGRTVAEALGRVTDYVKNPEKTNGGDLVTAYQCNPSIADQEFYSPSGSTPLLLAENGKTMI